MHTTSTSAMLAAIVVSLLAYQHSPPSAGSPDSTYLEQEQIQFQAAFEQCSKIHGYDPDQLPPLGDYELAPGERAWRACVYDAITTNLVPGSKSPELYRELITTDRILTDNVEKGTVTRADREKKIDSLIETIRTQETGHVIAEDPRMTAEEKERRTGFTRRMVKSMRGL